MIISQRLARKVCGHCREEYIANEKIRDYIQKQVGKYIEIKPELTLFKANP